MKSPLKTPAVISVSWQQIPKGDPHLWVLFAGAAAAAAVGFHAGGWMVVLVIPIPSCAHVA